MRLSSSSTSRMRRCNSGMLLHLGSGSPGGARRQTQRKDRSAFAPFVDRNTAAVREGNLLHDRQSESAAANAIGSTSAVERFEQMRQIARRDSRAAVFDGDRDAVTFSSRANRNP